MLKQKMRAIAFPFLNKITNLILKIWSRFSPSPLSPNPQHIFILRNNDLGDLLIITPLFAALKQYNPTVNITVGVGNWASSILHENPHIDHILPINAPWFNKGIPAPQQTLWHRLRYLSQSPEITALRQLKPDLGIDIFGSSWGAMLLLQAKISRRWGVAGYGGGEGAMEFCIPYHPDMQVGRSALRFAEALGATALPPCRPQLFLTAAEQEEGQTLWKGLGINKIKIVIGPGFDGDARYWGLANYQAIIAHFSQRQDLALVLVGGEGDRLQGSCFNPFPITNLMGQLSLRQTFALLAGADLVLCNSSMLMHAAAAFNVETLVLLGSAFRNPGQHDRQWGYQGNYRSLGGEQATVGEAIAQVESLLKGLKAP
ncbi:glycosyltransferase family 9 protein [Spirulina sp. CCNP1310]|uniref:glycosyltransferase family 9 protein n=1 Tax=Spirulina sp. CCNP1310 TaxID=3110249 RepID=UPI002B1F721E|nr:glycosyltransferase family 9 protein [Spirulina sp. CCNP1310]MEA5418759.1 glycosyltransferase family 9 protein [Spirulina sp. CCNP1310]